MLKLRAILLSILPFLFSAVERFFEKLPDKSKDALLKAGQFSQILKQAYAEGYEAFVDRVASELGMNQDAIDELLLALAKKMNIDIDAPNELFDRLQALVDRGLEDSSWDALWSTVNGQLSIILSGGRFNWATLFMGVIQFVYEKFIRTA